MIRIPADVICTVSRFMAKARRQLLWPDDSFEGHAARRSAIASEVIAHINRPVRSIIDIGCGLAMTTAAFALTLGPHTVTLIDGDGSIDLRPLMNDGVKLRCAYAAWADVRMGAAVVCANSEAVVFVAKPNDDFYIQADLIISTRALTYHFPFIQYATRIKRWLPIGGYIFLETRRDVDVIDIAERCGLSLSTVFERRTGKCKLILCERV